MADRIKHSYEHLAELPPANWWVASFRGMVIFMSSTHAPRVMYDGELTRLNPIPLIDSRTEN